MLVEHLTDDHDPQLRRMSEEEKDTTSRAGFNLPLATWANGGVPS